MQKYCSKCGAEAKFTLRLDETKEDCLNCRKILNDKCIVLLESGKIEEAKQIIIDSDNSSDWKNNRLNYFIPDFIRYKQMEREEKSAKDRRKNLEEANIFLKKQDFTKADQFILEKQSNLLLEEYESKTKFECIKTDLRSLEREIGIEEDYFDDEKAVVLSTTSKNILVQSRAGSGKTETIALKVRQLIKFYTAKPDEILVLAFNDNAAVNFRKRINKYCVEVPATEANTLTFHALAKRIANTTKNQLVDKKSQSREYNRHGKDETLQIDVVRECFNEVEGRERSFIGKLFYLFLKTASEKIKGAFRNDSEYYFYLRNQEYTTIAGEIVKSTGEKYIADFLFEHKISKNGKELEYAYERNIKKHLNTKYSYNPDFSLFYTEDQQREQLQAVIEYFGFTEKSPGYPGFFETEKESQKYLKESGEKRDLFSDGNTSFIEMSQDDFDNIKTNSSLDNEQVRNEFEKIIRRRLNEKGVDVSKQLCEKEILLKIPKVERRKKKLVEQITQFINKAQKLTYGPDEVREIAKEKKLNASLSKRNEYFIKIACQVYDEYQSRLKKENCTDFDGLFIDAIARIKKEGKKCKIVYHSEKEIGNIRYILVDEYQDFSELFFRLINEIRNVNPAISFFCVGDDWQAINGFAGSDLKYFENFNSQDENGGGNYFPGGIRTKLLTNHRSCKNIVWHSNLLMTGLGTGGEPRKNKPDGSVYLSELLRVEIRNDQEHIDEYTQDKKYIEAARSLLDKEDTNKSIPLEIARYLKTVEYIVSNKVDSKKEVCLLFRANKLHGLPIAKFADKIGEWSPKRPKILKKKVNRKDVLVNIDYSTVHSFKGKEKNVVIIVGANRRSFPKFHPDNELMEVLEVTMEKVRDEERRLFYVAITRAEEDLYLIYNEKIGMSDFISEIKSKGWQYLPIINRDLKEILPFNISDFL